MRALILFLPIVMVTCGSPSSGEKAELFSKGEPLGKVGKKLEEASGLVASVNNPGYLWTINDSGNPSDVYLLDRKAGIVLKCDLKKITNRDWEDITVGPGPEEGRSYLYVGDIGDNAAEFPVKFIYRFEEPVWKGDVDKMDVTSVDVLVVKLPDGIRDAEALTINPETRDLFLFSKREDSIRVYVAQFPYAGDTLVPQPIARLPIHNVVAADFSAKGDELLVKNYQHVYYWKKSPGESVEDLLKSAPILLPYEAEPQGEAIAWARDGSGYYTLSETVKDHRGTLLFYKRL